MAEEKYDKIPMKDTIPTHMRVHRMPPILSGSTEWYQFDLPEHTVEFQISGIRSNLAFTSSIGIDFSFEKNDSDRNVYYDTAYVTAQSEVGATTSRQFKWRANPKTVWIRRNTSTGVDIIPIITVAYITHEEYMKYCVEKK